MMKIFRAIYYGFIWSWCCSKLSQGKEKEVLKILNYGSSIASNRNPAFHIMRAQLNFVLGNKDKSYSELVLAMNLLKKLKQLKDSHLYLYLYSIKMGNLFGEDLFKEVKEDIGVRLQAIDYGKVSATYKRNFLMTVFD